MTERSDALVQKASELLLYTPPVMEAELGVVLGNRIVSGYVAKKAAALYHAGHFNQIAISGGLPAFQIIPPLYLFNVVSHGVYPHGLREKECALIKRILIANDVKEQDIVALDTSAKHTGDNFKKLASAITQVGSINIVTVAYHQRRALSTFRRWIEDRNIAATTTPVYPFHIPKEDWIGETQKHWARTSLRSIVWGEFDKCNPENPKSYIQRGLCVEVDPYKEAKKLGTTRIPTARPK